MQTFSPTLDQIYTFYRITEAKLPGKASGGMKQFLRPSLKQKDEIEDFNENDSCVGICNETKRQTSITSPEWHDTIRCKPPKKTNRKSKRDPYGKTNKKLRMNGMRENTDEDYRDDDWYDAENKSSLASSGNKRRTRSKSKQARKAQKKDEEVIEILDSTSEEESSEEEEFSLEESQTVDAEVC